MKAKVLDEDGQKAVVEMVDKSLSWYRNYRTYAPDTQLKMVE